MTVEQSIENAIMTFQKLVTCTVPIRGLKHVAVIEAALPDWYKR